MKIIELLNEVSDEVEVLLLFSEKHVSNLIRQRDEYIDAYNSGTISYSEFKVLILELRQRVERILNDDDLFLNFEKKREISKRCKRIIQDIWGFLRNFVEYITCMVFIIFKNGVSLSKLCYN